MLGPMTYPLAALLVLAAAVGCQSARESRGQAKPDRIEVVVAPADGDVADIVRAELLGSRSASRRLLVYVSASWCEPCRHFEQAVESGALDAEFPDLRLLKFDSDRDDPRLIEAGYDSRSIPLFVVPGPDGRGSEHRHAGAIKGPGAVEMLVPRLHALLDER